MPTTTADQLRDIRLLQEWIRHQQVHDARRLEAITALQPSLRADADAALTVRRRLINLHAPHGVRCDECSQPWEPDAGPIPWPCETVRIVLLHWARRPGYQDRWRPERAAHSDGSWTP